MKLPPNQIKTSLEGGEMTTGCWLSLSSVETTEIAANAGFDWCLIDGEHSPWNPTLVLDRLRALDAARCQAALRVPVADDWIIKQALDMGVQTLLVPMVHNAAAAADIVAATRYPPLGRRGMGAGGARATRYGRVTDYDTSANNEVLLLVQAESREAIENIDEIAATEGVGGVFIGPSDLSADMGFVGNPNAPEVISAIETSIARIHAAGKASGIITFDPAHITRYRELGVQFMAVAADGLALQHGLSAALAV
ncbi:MAG: HpcH/HpaI aldolase/citrate lyase family protein [Pseudomonadota bacterium]